MIGMVKVAQRAGFFYGWLVVAACGAMTMIAGGTFFFGFSAVFDPIIREFGWSRAATSVAYSLRAEVGGLEAPVIGVLLDRYGPRRVMRGGLVLLSLGMLAISQTNSIWMFYGGFMVATVGMGACGGLVGMMALTRWFRRRRGRAMALMTIGNGMGGLMVPVLAVLISNFGWRVALMVAAVYILAIGFPLTTLIGDRPQDLGLAPDGDPDPAADDPALAKDGEHLAAHALLAPAEEQAYSGREALRTRTFWIFATALTFVSLSGSAIITHLVPHFTHIGMPDKVAAMGMSALALISLVGRIAFGFAADIWDKRYVMAVAFGLQAVGCMALVLVQDLISALVVLAVLSPGFGGAVPVRPVLQAEYFGIQSFGTIQGLLMLVSTGGGVVGPVLAGWIFDVNGSYAMAWVGLGALTFVGIPLMLSLPRPDSPAGVRIGRIEALAH